ncbi:MAG: holo-ACP synthase [Spirochaetales bacterium]|nr:holo-ACP synthase [Spirochaetales bacterium]
MILGIGIDIVQVERLEKWGHNAGFIKRFFHPDEIIEAKKRGSSEYLSLAARFAAKEAFGKALGTGLKGICLKDIRVVSDYNGKPTIMVYRTAEEALKKLGAENIFVSLTHEKDNAVAMVVLEK